MNKLRLIVFIGLFFNLAFSWAQLQQKPATVKSSSAFQEELSNAYEKHMKSQMALHLAFVTGTYAKAIAQDKKITALNKKMVPGDHINNAKIQQEREKMTKDFVDQTRVEENKFYQDVLGANQKAFDEKVRKMNMDFTNNSAPSSPPPERK